MRRSREYDLRFDNRGNVINGVIEAYDDDIAMEAYSAMTENAVDLHTLGTGEVDTDMPHAIANNESFWKFVDERTERRKSLWDNGYCDLPWEVLKALPNEQIKMAGSRNGIRKLYWTQGNVGSCMSFGDSNAYTATILSNIAMGSNQVLCLVNSLVSWAKAKGGSLRGGLAVSEMAKAAITYGHFPEYLVGVYSTKLPQGYDNAEAEAMKLQGSPVFLSGKTPDDLTEETFRLCRAGIGVACANSTAVSGVTTDSNGIKVAVIRGSWAHAWAFVGHRKFKGEEYLAWCNSHGAIYGESEGCPGDMLWMPKHQVKQMFSTSRLYGQPYAVISESLWQTDNRLIADFQVKIPQGFKV